jgi:hypothetical protein
MSQPSTALHELGERWHLSLVWVYICLSVNDALVILFINFAPRQLFNGNETRVLVDCAGWRLQHSSTLSHGNIYK